MVKVIAGEVRRYRLARKPRMSTEALSRRTEELGLHIRRSVLANLESGRRNTLSVPELLILAEALQVAPALLIAPVRADTVEILPGREVDPWEAVLWLGGQHDPDVEWVRSHDWYVRDWQQAADRLADAPPRPPGLGEDPMVKVVEEHRRASEITIRRIRADMRERGMRPPALPPELAHIEAGEPV
jgi:transcriptional regulator with XRE-family HTH domain